MRIRGLVELIDVDQRKHREGDVQVELVLKIDLVVVIVAQFWWQNDLAETRLSAALTTNQQRR